MTVNQTALHWPQLVAPGWAEAIYTRTVKEETSFSEVLTDTTLLAQHKDGVYTAS